VREMMNYAQKVPSYIRLVVPATNEELVGWEEDRARGQQDLYLIAAASRLGIGAGQVTTEQRSLMKVTILSSLYSGQFYDNDQAIDIDPKGT